jgi:hypothetical protein
MLTHHSTWVLLTKTHNASLMLIQLLNLLLKQQSLLRGEIVSGDESKRKQAEEWNKLYRRMVEVCLELKKSSEAIEYIERSKTRNLVELLFSP